MKNDVVPGFRGFLLFVVITACISPFVWIFRFWQISSIKVDRSAPGYNQVASMLNDPMLTLAVRIEYFAIVVFFLWSIINLIPMFSKNKAFPLIIRIYLISVSIICVLLVITYCLIPTLPSEILHELIGGAIGALVGNILWLLYFNYSKRVSVTFVNN